MIIYFNKLKIDTISNQTCSTCKSNKKMIIDLQVQRLDKYENIYVDAVYVDNQLTFVLGVIPTTPLYTYQTLTSSKVKDIYLELTNDDLKDEEYGNEGTLETDIFFITVVLKGDLSEEAKCECIDLLIGVVYDNEPLYLKGMLYIKDMECPCSILSGMIDFILREKALEYSILTGNFTQTVKLWKKFFMTNESDCRIQTCSGCN